MRALSWMGPEGFVVAEQAPVVAEVGETVVDVERVGLCGTDLHIAAGDHPRATSPLVLGHEIVGRARTGIHAGRMVMVNPLLPCGDCLVCRGGDGHVCERLRLLGIDRDGGLTDSIAVPDRALHPVPDDLDPSLAVLTEPLAVAVHAVELAELLAGERVVIAGAGPIGLLLALVARDRGAEVHLIEPVEARAATAAELGFPLLDPRDPEADLRARTDGQLAQVVFDAAAAEPVAAIVTRLVPPRGRIVVVGSYGAPAAVDLQAVTFKELRVLGSRVYTDQDIAAAIEATSRLRAFLPALLTETVALDEVPDALDGLAAGRGVKVVADVRRAS